MREIARPLKPVKHQHISDPNVQKRLTWSHRTLFRMRVAGRVRVMAPTYQFDINKRWFQDKKFVRLQPPQSAQNHRIWMTIGKTKKEELR